MDDFDQWAAPEYPVFLGSEYQQGDANSAYFHILPEPYEGSVSYGGGTAQGPKKILEASWQLESWDGKCEPGNHGIFTHAPVNCDGKPAAVIDAIAEATQAIVRDDNDRCIIGLGGEHSVTWGIIKGLIAAGEDDIGIVQIDAHADLRDAYEGNPFSHASVMKRIVDEDIPVFQLGVRALCREEIDTRKVHGVKHLDAHVLVPKNVTQFELPDDFPDHVFFTLDIDGMDPSIFPAPGTPVPGGLGWYQTLALFESVVKQRRIIGFDIMEFSPIEGFHAYEFAAAQLAYKMMGIVARNQL
jgi:agmatinase